MFPGIDDVRYYTEPFLNRVLVSLVFCRSKHRQELGFHFEQTFPIFPSLSAGGIGYRLRSDTERKGRMCAAVR